MSAQWWANEFLAWADHPAESGMVPVHPDTLRKVAAILAHEPRGVLTDTEFSVIFMRTGIPQKIIAGLDVTPGDWFEFALAVQAFDRRTPTKGAVK